MNEFKWPLNLQLFAEDDGEDLSDGFDDTPIDESDGFDSEDTGTAEVEQPQAEDTKPAEEPTTTEHVQETQTPQPFKLKYNGQDREVSAEEGQALMQKGMNYEKAQERARQEGIDSYIANQGMEWNGKKITNEAEYKQALAEQELMRTYENLPPELVDELMAGRRDREERAKEREAATAKAKQEADINDFLAYFASVNGRPFDGNKDVVPASVWEAQRNGTPLRYAYMEHHTTELRNQLQISKQNESNSKKATSGSVTSHGNNKTAAEDPFLEGFNSI